MSVFSPDIRQHIEEMVKQVEALEVAGGGGVVAWGESKPKMTAYLYDVVQNQARGTSYFAGVPYSDLVNYALLRLIVDEIIPARIEGWDKKERIGVIKAAGELWPPMGKRRNTAGRPME